MEKAIEVEKVENLIAKVEQKRDLIDEHKSCNEDSVKLLWNVLKCLSSDDIKIERYDEFTKQLNLLSAKCHEHMKEVYHNGTNRKWRRLYTDCMLFTAFLTLRKEAFVDGDEKRMKSTRNAIKGLDMAIIVAGAPGRDRMDVIHDTIKVLQSNLEDAIQSPKRDLGRSISDKKLSNSFCVAQNSIPTLHEVPDIEKFLSVCQSRPYVIPRGASDWPAFQGEGSEDDNLLSSWSSTEYLLEVSGPGRSVPVEIGKNYMDKEWSQMIIPWEVFLSGIDWDEKSEDRNDKLCKDDHLSIRYLAQYNLFDQFPQLRKDVLFPDLLFSSPPAPDWFPSYKPLIDSEDGMETFALNAWLGPNSTVSPAHRDPHYNYYAQIVGQKLVWIAPPQKDIEKELRLEDGISSQIDVFDEQIFDLYPEFVKIVQSKSMFAILQPGDTLIIPPGWFHAFKSLTKSFSVSMWF